jgi:small conductance mechanosensitive channel
VIGTLAVLLALPEFGFTVGPAALIAGLVILAVGIGARGVIADLAAGLLVLKEDQFSIGDSVRANGETGRVEQFTLRRTLIRNERGALITIPNRLIEGVANLSRDWSQTIVDVTLPSSELIGPAIRVLESVSAGFREDPIWSPALVDGPRVLGVESLDLEGTNLRVQVRTMLQRQEDVARELRRRIRIAFEEAAILTGGVQRVELVNSSKANYETKVKTEMEEPDGRSHA